MFGILGRDRLAVHIHSNLFRILHVKLRWAVSSNLGPVAQHAVVMLFPLVRLVPRYSVVWVGILVGWREILSLSSVLRLLTDRGSSAVSLLSYELPSEPEGVTILGHSLLAQVPL